MSRKKHHGLSLEHRRSMYGRMFVLPWFVGFLLYFLFPLIRSIQFSFSKVQIAPEGFTATFSGLANYYDVWKLDPNFRSNFTKSLSSFIYMVPIVVILSFILAIILNQKFRGRLVARAIFFMPTIIACGVVLTCFNLDASSMSGISSEAGNNGYISGAIDFTEILKSLGLPNVLLDTILPYLEQVSSIIWKCGIQILLFISGLQSIPVSLYEASRVEGATAWEEFWFITFPMMFNVMIVTLIYTVIDNLTSNDNLVMRQAYSLINTNQVYDQSAAMLWSYFPIVGAIVAILLVLIQQTIGRKWSA